MKTDDDKVEPWLLILVTVFIAALLVMLFVTEMYPEHWFVSRFLLGWRFWIGGLVLFIIIVWVSAIRGDAGKKGRHQRRSKRSDFRSSAKYLAPN
jgi:hypothetical protein